MTSKLLKPPIHIPEWSMKPWHEHSVHMHTSYSPRLRETTLTLFTKDHKKIVRISDQQHSNLKTDYEKNNWSLIQKREWQKELETLYKSRGD